MKRAHRRTSSDDGSDTEARIDEAQINHQSAGRVTPSDAASELDERIEWESTIECVSCAQEFEAAQQVTCADDEARRHSRTDVIFLLSNETRLANRRVETKRYTASHRILGFCEGDIYALHRSAAVETLVAYDPTARFVQATHRIILQHATLGADLDEGAGARSDDDLVLEARALAATKPVRQTFNKIESPCGVRYTVAYEIEYPEGSSYELERECEARLMRVARAHNCQALDRRTQPMSCKQMFACVPTKLQMWHCFDAQRPFKWAYKWNGYKAKMLLKSEHSDCGGSSAGASEQLVAYVWSDMQSIEIMRFVELSPATRQLLRLIVNVCVLVEIMPDRVVVIEIIGTLFDDGYIYTTEPRTNVSMLALLEDLDAPLMCGRSLSAQRFFDGVGGAPPSEYDDSLHDGIIVAQDDKLIKWKYPTVDVQCVAPHTYSVAGQQLHLEPEGQVSAIYELGPEHQILRQRLDRIAPSSELEYKMFVKSARYLRRK